MMKKSFLLPAVLLSSLFLFTAAKPANRGVIDTKNTIKTGSDFTDFIIGMKNTTVYKLKDMAGKRFIVLTFLDSSSASVKLASAISSEIESMKSTKPGLFWLNITGGKKYVEIDEMTSVLKLRYRTLIKDIPRAYSFSTRPAVIIIDPHGIVQFMYLGYSPTILDDIKKWLRSAK